MKYVPFRLIFSHKNTLTAIRNLQKQVTISDVLPLNCIYITSIRKHEVFCAVK